MSVISDNDYVSIYMTTFHAICIEKAALSVMYTSGTKMIESKSIAEKCHACTIQRRSGNLFPTLCKVVKCYTLYHLPVVVPTRADSLYKCKQYCSIDERFKHFNMYQS